MRATRGHRFLPHTADLRFEAWGPDESSCLEEAASALCESFAEVHATPAATAVFEVGGEDFGGLVVGVLDEVIYLSDTSDQIPVGILIEELRPGTVSGAILTVSRDHAEIIGSAPKAVSLSDLTAGRLGRSWRCRVTVDV